MSIDIPSAPPNGDDLPPEDRDRLRHAADRRMCAAAYVDADFRNSLLNDVYYDRARRVAPSHGFDIVFVMWHAWRAWWLDAGQNLVVLGVLVVGFVYYPLSTIIALLALMIWYVLRTMIGLGAGLYGFYYHGDVSFLEYQRIQVRSKLQRRLLYALGIALIVAMCFSYEITGRAGESSAPWADRTGLLGAAAVLAYLAGAVAVGSVIRYVWLGHLRFEDIPDKEARGRRMRTINSQQYHPFTVHSGANPFIGSGIRLQGWSFAQRLVRAKNTDSDPDVEFDEPPFTTQEVIDALKKMIYGLRDDTNPQTRLPGLDVSDHVLVEGTHADRFRQALGAAKDSAEVERAITAAIKNPVDAARHYLACRVESWGGEIVTSVFVHVSLQGRTLYLEFSTYALLPTRQEYHIIDESGGTGFAASMKEIGKNLFDLPEKLVGGYRVIGVPLRAWVSLRPYKNEADRKFLRTDIGSQMSIRESAAIESDETYFQYQDILQHSKIIERRLFTTIGEYLKGLKVDTSEFWQRATAILNNGVIVTGSGTVNVTNSAFGQDSSVTNQAGPGPSAQPGPAEGQN
jgi:hypothetical protein